MPGPLFFLKEGRTGRRGEGGELENNRVID
jgi:hypothetical protein